MDIDLSQLDDRLKYNLLNGAVVPRPIAWVSTMDNEGRLNLAPFSSFALCSYSPPLLSFCPTLKTIEKDGQKINVPKDTLRNIGNTYEFVVNIVSFDLVEKMNSTAGQYEPGISEFEEVGLTPAPSRLVKPPRVKEARISFECTLHAVLNFGTHANAGNMVIGNIVSAHVAEDVWVGGHVLPEVLNPVGRLAGTDYCKVTDIFQLPRPWTIA